MALAKKNKSDRGESMISDDDIEKSNDEFYTAPIENETRHNISRVSFQRDDDDQDDYESQIFKFNDREEKIEKNATDDEKLEISKEWQELQDERIQEDDSDIITIKAADKNFKSTSDIFSFRDCGEPQTDQFLSLDFSPEEGVDDDDFVLEKCIHFWKLIEKHPELQSLRAEPEDLEYEEDSFVSRTPSPISTKSSIGLDLSSPSSISILASTWLKKEDLMSAALVTKTEGQCKPESYKYTDYQLEKPIKTVTRKKLGLHASKSHVRVGASNQSIKRSQPTTYTLDDLGKMMADMRKFDIEHLTSLDSPGHPLSLIHAQMIRNESILPFIKTGRS